MRGFAAAARSCAALENRFAIGGTLTEIELGTVYSSELGITILSEVDRYTLEDAVVEISCFLRLADGSYEKVPMGVFEVSEANRTAKCILKENGADLAMVIDPKTIVTAAWTVYK